MTKRQKKKLIKICEELVRDGSAEYNVTEYYRILHRVAWKRFTEDNKPTLDGFLTECHLKAQETHFRTRKIVEECEIINGKEVPLNEGRI